MYTEVKIKLGSKWAAIRRGSCRSENGNRRSNARMRSVTSPHDHHCVSDASRARFACPLARLGSAKTAPIAVHAKAATTNRVILFLISALDWYCIVRPMSELYLVSKRT